MKQPPLAACGAKVYAEFPTKSPFLLPRLIYFREASSVHYSLEWQVGIFFYKKMIGAKNGDYEYDVFLICNRTIIKF